MIISTVGSTAGRAALAAGFTLGVLVLLAIAPAAAKAQDFEDPIEVSVQRVDGWAVVTGRAAGHVLWRTRLAPAEDQGIALDRGREISIIAIGDREYMVNNYTGAARPVLRRYRDYGQRPFPRPPRQEQNPNQSPGQEQQQQQQSQQEQQQSQRQADQWQRQLAMLSPSQRQQAVEMRQLLESLDEANQRLVSAVAQLNELQSNEASQGELEQARAAVESARARWRVLSRAAAGELGRISGEIARQAQPSPPKSEQTLEAERRADELASRLMAEAAQLQRMRMDDAPEKQIQRQQQTVERLREQLDQARQALASARQQDLRQQASRDGRVQDLERQVDQLQNRLREIQQRLASGENRDQASAELKQAREQLEQAAQQLQAIQKQLDQMRSGPPSQGGQSNSGGRGGENGGGDKPFM